MSYTKINFKKDWDEQIDPHAGYRFVLAYMISELRLMPFEDWKAEDLDECLEARFFGEDEELHVFQKDDRWKAVTVQDLSYGDDEDVTVKNYAFVDRAYKIRHNCQVEVRGYKEIIVREYIDYDQDGQAKTVKTRLVGLQ